MVEVYIISGDRERFHIEAESRYLIRYLSQFLYHVYLPPAFVKVFVVVDEVHSCELVKVVEYCRYRNVLDCMVIEDAKAGMDNREGFLKSFFKNQNLEKLYRAALTLRVRSLMDAIKEERDKREEKKMKKKEKKMRKQKWLLHFGSSC